MKDQEVFVSSSCIRAEKIVDSVRILSDAGFDCIELSGGTQPYDSMEEELIALQHERSLKFRPHNYFPPPTSPFVLNLASESEAVQQQSLDLIREALRIGSRLGACAYGFHAGFYMDISTTQIGKKIHTSRLNSPIESKRRFIKNVKKLSEWSSDINLYIENNVFSFSNSKSFPDQIPFMLLSFEDYKDLREELNFDLLLDVAHLKVSCQTLGLDFREEFFNLIQVSDYLHISDNDGLHDTNGPIRRNSELVSLLKENGLAGKTLTLEIYSGLEDLRFAYDLIRGEIYA